LTEVTIEAESASAIKANERGDKDGTADVHSIGRAGGSGAQPLARRVSAEDHVTDLAE